MIGREAQTFIPLSELGRLPCFFCILNRINVQKSVAGVAFTIWQKEDRHDAKVKSKYHILSLPSQPHVASSLLYSLRTVEKKTFTTVNSGEWIPKIYFTAYSN